MVDDFANLGIFRARNGLRDFVVVDEDQFSARLLDKAGASDDANELIAFKYRQPLILAVEQGFLGGVEQFVVRQTQRLGPGKVPALPPCKLSD